MTQPPPAAPPLQAVLVARAARLAELGRWDDLLGAAAAVLAHDPRHARALAWTAQAELSRPVPDGRAARQAAARALAAADAYVAQRPGSEWGHRLRSVALLRLPRRAGEAETAAREAVRVEPMAPEAHEQLARVCLARRRPGAAQAAADERARLAPADAASHVRLSDVAAARRRWAAAEAHARDALRLAPTDPDAQSALAAALAARGRTGEAVEAAYDAARAAPSRQATALLLDTFDRQLDRPVLRIGGLALVGLVAGAAASSRLPAPARGWAALAVVVVTLGSVMVAPVWLAVRARRRASPRVRAAVEALVPWWENVRRVAGLPVAVLAPLIFLRDAVDMARDPNMRPGPVGTVAYLAVVAAWAWVACATWRSYRRLAERTGRR